MSATSFLSNPSNCLAKWSVLAFLLVAFSGSLWGDDVQLTWSDNSDNEDGFNIERSVGDGSFELIAQVGPDSEAYVDTTAEAGVEYSYRVNAYNAFGDSGYTNVAPHYINVAPTISSLLAVEVEENESTGELSFSVSDFEAAAGELVVTVSSSNLDLIDADGILLGGSGADRTLSLMPNANSSGEATITLTVSDGEDIASTEFLYSVNAFEFPTLQLAVDTIGSAPRVGEAFSLSSSASDVSLISSVSYFLDGELLGEVASSPYAFTMDVSMEGGYELSAVATIEGRVETVTSLKGIVVGPAPSSSSIVDNLRTLSVDDEAGSGTASYDLASDEFYLENENGLIAGDSDSHRYYFLRADGDVSISANLNELSAASSQSVAGLMLRSALFGMAKQTSLLRDAAGKLEVRTRDLRGGATESVGGFETSSGDSWLRIDRVGGTVRYYSRASASSEWGLLREEVIDLGESVFLGFAVAGGSQSGMASASFTQASLQGQILPLGDDAVKPDIPSGLIISGITQ
ncbi:Ig-like domain-containing protein [Pelagicoccus mobilis]|uniref:Fibronectin type III domain-containing protein n=1 Tax=Pelagicoccus mobilis TaxID=415221 RepID=A0A934RV49_9BACT|nr:fibronectin type III domain-containing protein [Pelagicoccus mobilis]MBK1876000.1 fibronectin type III domain-containing protein [Pelagicoccus mobilis]